MVVVLPPPVGLGILDCHPERSEGSGCVDNSLGCVICPLFENIQGLFCCYGTADGEAQEE